MTPEQTALQEHSQKISYAILLDVGTIRDELHKKLGENEKITNIIVFNGMIEALSVAMLLMIADSGDESKDSVVNRLKDEVTRKVHFALKEVLAQYTGMAYVVTDEGGKDAKGHEEDTDHPRTERGGIRPEQ